MLEYKTKGLKCTILLKNKNFYSDFYTLIINKGCVDSLKL